MDFAVEFGILLLAFVVLLKFSWLALCGLFVFGFMLFVAMLDFNIDEINDGVDKWIGW